MEYKFVATNPVKITSSNDISLNNKAITSTWYEEGSNDEETFCRINIKGVSSAKKYGTTIEWDLAPLFKYNGDDFISSTSLFIKLNFRASIEYNESYRDKTYFNIVLLYADGTEAERFTWGYWYDSEVSANTWKWIRSGLSNMTHNDIKKFLYGELFSKIRLEISTNVNHNWTLDFDQISVYNSDIYEIPRTKLFIEPENKWLSAKNILSYKDGSWNQISASKLSNLLPYPGKWYSYAINYYYNDGTNKVVTNTISNLDSKPFTFQIDDTIKLSREGYQHIGWNTKKDGTGQAYNLEGSITTDKSISLYAVWVKM